MKTRWVVTMSPIPGIRHTVFVFKNENEAGAFIDRMHEICKRNHYSGFSTELVQAPYNTKE